jgi:hypothetical protein
VGKLVEDVENTLSQGKRTSKLNLCFLSWLNFLMTDFFQVLFFWAIFYGHTW